MQSTVAMVGMDRNPVSPQNLNNPIPLYHELREHEPVHWSEPLQAWFVTRHEDVVACFRDPRLSAERWKFFEYQIQGLEPETIREFMETTRDQMVMRAGPEHTRVRRQAGAGFTPMKLEEMRACIHHTMEELLEGVRERRWMNLAQEISYPLPTRVLAELLGVPAEDRERFRRWSDTLAEFAAPAAGASMLGAARRANQAMMEMKAYFLPLLEQRRARPTPDALGMMVQAEELGHMTAGELVANAILLMFAGHTTTTDQLSNCVHDLLTHPEQLQLLREEPERVRAAVEESVRFHPAVPFIFRVAIADVELHGRRIHAGDVVFLGMAAANRDPRAFPEPDRFDITRDHAQHRHLSFGFGTHHCMGAGLARRELETGITLLLQHLPGLRLDETRPARLKCHSLNFRGFDVLPVRW
ncbi:cytochrome P450 [Cystobacter fuscus]|uniref:cytochrome P450 n=1 Tax=Cystobacter fuscus TaxID=43 RepID=UPI002B319C59|nr:cytochrome P450 [Cystobacter fuscus]